MKNSEIYSLDYDDLTDLCIKLRDEVARLEKIFKNVESKLYPPWVSDDPMSDEDRVEVLERILGTVRSALNPEWAEKILSDKWPRGGGGE